VSATKARDLRETIQSSFVAMAWLSSLLTRFANAAEWREIATAPFDRELELAIIDGGVGVLRSCCIRHGNGWLDAETLKPVDIAATHWRFRQPDFPPVSCC
jgi:hypothetical protein